MIGAFRWWRRVDSRGTGRRILLASLRSYVSSVLKMDRFVNITEVLGTAPQGSVAKVVLSDPKNNKNKENDFSHSIKLLSTFLLITV